jgi:uncharacterized protein YegP (UPF0339 family)
VAGEKEMGIFIINTTEAGFHFILLAGNGQIIGTSQVYSSKDAALGGIEGVKKVAGVAAIEDTTMAGHEVAKNPKFVISPAANGKIHWNLQAPNGQVILSSQQYLSVKNALKGIASVQKNGPIGTLEEGIVIHK